MKIYLTLLFLLIWKINLFADCSGKGLELFPSGKTLRQNSIIVLDGYATSQKIIIGLNKKYPIYLKSGKNKIKLLVKDICIGQYDITQAILKPERPLQIGIEYTIHIDNLSEDESLKHYNEITRQNEPIKYKVIAESDFEAPIIKSNPKEAKKIIIEYGCGPEIYVVFNFSITDSSEILVKTTIKNLKSGIETTYYIKPTNNQIEVGHGMCSGAFTFDESLYYEVEFVFMDSSGNFTNLSENKIKFTKPIQRNK